MDPDATLHRFLEAILDRDSHEMINAAIDLAAWLRAGGATPVSLQALVAALVGSDPPEGVPRYELTPAGRGALSEPTES